MASKISHFVSPQVLTAILALGAQVGQAWAQDTAFTYQGRLEDGGVPADGPYDFRFRLFNDAVGNAQVGQTLCVEGLDVTNGLFTVELDFGQQFATTAQRHLDVQVREEIGQPCTDDFGYVLLSPRQQITPVPLAIHAHTAANADHAAAAFALDAADGSPIDAVFVDNDGRVGIGTTAPSTKLHVQGAEEGIRIEGPTFGNANLAYVTFSGSDGADIGYVGDGSNGDSNVFLGTYTGDACLVTLAGRVLTAKAGGNVGIGTTAPLAKLDVRGDVKLGPSGEFFAASSGENLRIVRGTSVHNGLDPPSIGFSVSRVDTGDYNITFDPPFAGPPAVTASVNTSAGFLAIAMVDVISASLCKVRVLRVNTAGLDSTFTFIAVGPR